MRRGRARPGGGGSHPARPRQRGRRREARAGWPSGDRGAITAELALALPVVVLVLAVLLVTTGAAATRLRCADAARAAARVAALGEANSEIVAVAERIAGSGATVGVVRDPPWVEVTVSAAVPGGWFSGGSIGLSASATAWAEP